MIAWIDDANGENTIYLKIGRDFDPSGIVQNWSVEIPVPGPIGYDSAGLGIALTDLRGNGRPDLVITWVDDRAGGITGFLKVGWDIDGTGTPIGGWSVKQELPGWWGANTQESGLAVAPIRGFRTATYWWPNWTTRTGTTSSTTACSPRRCRRGSRPVRWLRAMPRSRRASWTT